MKKRTGSEPAPRPETADPHNANEAPDRTQAGGDANESGKPALSLVSDSPGHSSHVEDGFFAKGAADDKAALEMYAAMLPRGYSFKQINPRYLIIAGAAVLLLVGVAAGRHLPGGSQSQSAPSPTAEASPSVAPAPAIPAPAAAAPTGPSPVPAAAAPATPETTAPAPAPTVAAAPAEQPAAQVATPTPPSAAPVEPVAKQEAPTPAPAVAAAPAEQPAAQPDKAPAPVVAAAPAEQPAAQPVVAAAPVVAAPAPEPKATEPQPAAAAPAEPAAVAAQAPSVQACRDAIKKRDAKGVSTSCEAALTADASLAKPLLGFAKSQFEKGKSAQAAIWARKIIQVNGSLADAYLIMGAAEQEAHHAAAAKTAYQRYLELAPRGPYADDVRSSLKSL